MDLSAYSNELQANSDTLLKLLHTLEENKLSEKPNNEWSILEIAEHIYRADRTFIHVITQDSVKYHESEEIRGSTKIKYLLVDSRARKVKAPDFLEPKGKFSSIQDFENVFLQQRTSLIEKLENGSISDFTAIFPHPFLGELTVTDWLYVILHHTSRHVEQINDRLRAIK
ncbi:MAG: DinB family protein [Bacteroidetes bacterium]|nr:DinB family protein [Bacteroidota bacterium]